MDARNACLVELVFEVPDAEQQQQQVERSKDGNDVGTACRLVEIKSEMIDLSEYEPSSCAQQIVDKHMSVVQALENEIIIQADSIVSFPPGVPFSSKRSRFQQTTIGGVFCQMIKEELEGCDVAMVNGAVIKGDRVYENAAMSYAELKNEFPFPTKIVMVEMTRREVNEAVRYSRTAMEAGTDPGSAETEVPRRGYLQMDYDCDREWGQEPLREANAGDTVEEERFDDILRVALPRNLLQGFCKIKPLMTVGKRLKEEGKFPGEDDFVPAIDLIVRHASKNRWLDLVRDENDFNRFDLNNDGMLDKDEIKTMMKEILGYEPADFVVDDMIEAIDADENGAIDGDEFRLLLARMERENDISKKN